jgi:hypothetical protein
VPALQPKELNKQTFGENCHYIAGLLNRNRKRINNNTTTNMGGMPS